MNAEQSGTGNTGKDNGTDDIPLDDDQPVTTLAIGEEDGGTTQPGPHVEIPVS